MGRGELPHAPGPIGIFDSGYGGLTILQSIRRQLPQYDYVYLGDNARAPYGTRSFQVVCEFTTQAVHRLFQMGCHLVVLACNTASAKALRTIQQQSLPQWDPERRVLGVVRPTVECVGDITHTRHVGIFATQGTIASQTYDIEIGKLHPDITVTGLACPLWVPLVEHGEYATPGAEYFVKKRIDQLLSADPLIDTIILGCTHYPVLLPLILKHTPSHVRVIPQGDYVATSLASYIERHPEMDVRLTRGGTCRYFTTEDADRFAQSASVFVGEPITAHRIPLIP